MISEMTLEQLQVEVLCMDRDYYDRVVDEPRFLNNGYTREELIEILQKWIEESPDF